MSNDNTVLFTILYLIAKSFLFSIYFAYLLCFYLFKPFFLGKLMRQLVQILYVFHLHNLLNCWFLFLVWTSFEVLKDVLDTSEVTLNDLLYLFRSVFVILINCLLQFLDCYRWEKDLFKAFYLNITNTYISLNLSFAYNNNIVSGIFLFNEVDLLEGKFLNIIDKEYFSPFLPTHSKCNLHVESSLFYYLQ